MAQNELWRRYLDAGVAFTEMTRQRAEAIIKEMVGAGHIPRKRAEESITELVERSRENTEALVQMVQEQVKEHLSSLGLATKGDIARLEAKLDELAGQARKAATPRKTAAKKTAVTKTAVAKTAAAKRASAVKQA